MSGRRAPSGCHRNGRIRGDRQGEANELRHSERIGRHQSAEQCPICRSPAGPIERRNEIVLQVDGYLGCERVVRLIDGARGGRRRGLSDGFRTHGGSQCGRQPCDVSHRRTPVLEEDRAPRQLTDCTGGPGLVLGSARPPAPSGAPDRVPGSLRRDLRTGTAPFSVHWPTRRATTTSCCAIWSGPGSRRKGAGRRSTSGASLAIAILAVAPLLSATTLAWAAGLSIKSATAMLDGFGADEFAVEVTHRSAAAVRAFRHGAGP